MAQRGVHRMDAVAMVVAIIGVSFSGPLMAGTVTASAIAIAFWRTALGAAATAPLVWRERELLRALPRRSLWQTVGAGLFLAAHFATWIPSLHFTSIAAATTLVCTQVVWAAIGDRLSGQRAPRMVWAGIAIALVGAVTLTGIDFSLEPRALVGDLLAVAGAIFAAGYYFLGQRARVHVPANTYSLLAYLVAAGALAIVAIAGTVPLSGFAARDWWLILGVTVFAQIGGHSMLNLALRSFGATTISLALLLEIPGAVLVGWVWPGQAPSWQLFPAIALILAGLVVVLRAEKPVDVVDPQS